MKILPPKDEGSGDWIVSKARAGGYLLAALVLSGAYTLTPTSETGGLETYTAAHAIEHKDLVEMMENRCERGQQSLGDVVRTLERQSTAIDRILEAQVSIERVIDRLDSK
jgi:hypothetical protein